MLTDFNGLFADRVMRVQKSFIREILKVAADSEIISFAGGLPNPELFPVADIQKACNDLLEEEGRSVLQYSTTEGYAPLREMIAQQYRDQYNLDVSADNILVTNGSQQGLDLLAKILIEPGDRVLIESPGYLGAIQALSLYQPEFVTVPLTDNGPALEAFKQAFDKPVKLYYSVPNFQNPSGVTYSAKVRGEVAEILNNTQTLLVEDNPYGALRFMGEDIPPIKTQVGNQSILLGSFSKTVVPSFRLGWVCADLPIMEKLIVAKQGSDLHTNYFGQRIVHHFYTRGNIDTHMANIKEAYRVQRDAMVNMIEKYFPENIQFTRPEGGMFIWVTMPEHISSMELFDLAIEQKVAFVPGDPFYVDGGGKNSFRLNYSNANPEQIEAGISKLGDVMKKMMD